MVTSGVLGIVLAYIGLGAWALVGQQLINQFVITLILWFTVKWRPKLIFSINRVKALFSFGWKLLVSSLIDTFYNNIRSLIIGKIYSPAILGYYNRGQQFPLLIVSNIDSSIQSVMFPVLASHQEDRMRIKDMVRRSIVTSSFIIFPLMVGLAVIAEPLVRILLTDKWLPAVPFLQILCGAYLIWPIHTANLQAINALGRSDIFLKLEIIKKIVGIIILCVSIPFGIYGVVLGELIFGVIATFINAFPNLKLLNYSYKEQWKDIMPSLILSLVMGAVIYNFTWFRFATWLTLIVQLLVGAI
jgi:O-antigen/teichoic acid export membrane protein